MRMPNFLIIGAGKSGTTSLFNYTRQHPQLFMSERKDIRFFGHEGCAPEYTGPGASSIYHDPVTEMSQYERYFVGADGFPARGETSNYMVLPKAAEQIHRHLPEVRLIAILRNPVERAFSAFAANRRDGFEPEPEFERALDLEPHRQQENWGPTWYYRSNSRYYYRLREFYDRFPKERIHVYLTEDLARDPVGVCQDIFGHLGIDASFVPNTKTRYNVSGVPRFGQLYRLLAGPTLINRLGKLLLPKDLRTTIRAGTIDKAIVKSTKPMALREKLLEQFRDDNLRLQGLIDRDLSAWNSETLGPRSEPDTGSLSG